MPENTLQKIIDKKKIRINELKKNISLNDLNVKIKDYKNFINFKEKIIKNISEHKFSLIAEVKKASPSAGIIMKNYNPVEIAEIYYKNKAACLSVLTEEDFFLGNLIHITKIKEQIKLPILCKDFFIDPFQVHLAKSSGADILPVDSGENVKSLPVLPASYEELRSAALSCDRCQLAESRTQVVFSYGAVDARLVVVGEAPGANEDRTGVPFVGAAGRYLDLLLATVGMSRRDSVYICNVLKCRPPGNRNPMADEISACSSFLEKQLELVHPEALLAVGSFAAQLLTGQEKTALGRL